MAVWEPAAIEIDTQQWTLRDLREGDLVFGQRIGGPFAALCTAADEPWMHVGSLTRDQNGKLAVIELRLQNLYLTELETFFSADRYHVFGAARLRLDDDCVARANDWMKAKLQGERTATQDSYPWDDYLLAGVIAAGHRGLVAKHPDAVRAAIAAAAAYAKEVPDDIDEEMSLTCSAFMQVAYDLAGGDCVIEHPRWRSEPVSWPGRSPYIDELLEMTEEELSGYDETSLVDVYLEHEGVDRGASRSMTELKMVASSMRNDMSKEEWGTMFKVVLAAIAGLAFGTAPSAGELGADSRWVTPGDLWRSPTVLERACVTVDSSDG